MHDTKLELHDYIQEPGVPYTFVDVGNWMETLSPLPKRTVVPAPLQVIAHTMYNSERGRMLLVGPTHVGKWVARIVKDPRTVTKIVLVWEGEMMHNDFLEIADRVSGEGGMFETATLEGLRKAQK
ncbi:uncharacterized protein BXZ73DRAFT_103069 [Epithele typhae]|uniref:uncharacterized protein n=1 Tax=Epithele typhae TaxID=378194 RepID=UPI002008D9EC|nr:uncharacterized protein BXZ73DRAFT_103069 [Epithele typhae]KAH9925897.1 hypothetical protein BXZ73DRAFT_103069 [Epithele typhae]